MQYILNEQEYKTTVENESTAKIAIAQVENWKKIKPTCTRYPNGYNELDPSEPVAYCSENCPFAFTRSLKDMREPMCILDRPCRYGK